MKRRWAIYALIGIVFGVFDFFYQEIIQKLLPNDPIWVIAIFAIWLVPAVLVVIREIKVSGSRIKAALSNVLAWSSAIVSYYLFMFIRVVLIGQSSTDYMHISHRSDPFYWSNIKGFLLNDVLSSGIKEWILLALIGGFITGWLISLLYLLLKKKPAVQLIEK